LFSSEERVEKTFAARTKRRAGGNLGLKENECQQEEHPDRLASPNRHGWGIILKGRKTRKYNFPLGGGGGGGEGVNGGQKKCISSVGKPCWWADVLTSGLGKERTRGRIKEFPIAEMVHERIALHQPQGDSGGVHGKIDPC